jgi:hypothetical protein
LYSMVASLWAWCSRFADSGHRRRRDFSSSGFSNGFFIVFVFKDGFFIGM